MPILGARVQNGSSLPFSPERLAGMTSPELAAVANGHHREYRGAMRKAIVYHARLAGEALRRVKERFRKLKCLKNGIWARWRKKNFKGSAETARLYVRIAENWDQIVAHGLDNLPELTLEDLRYFLSEPKPEKPEEREEAKPTPSPGPNPPKDSDDVPRSQVRQFQLRLSRDEMKEFERMLRSLKERFKAPTLNDAAFIAVKRCYLEGDDD